MPPKVDPRTSLPIIDIPSKYLPALNNLQSSIIHWIGPVGKVGSQFKEGSKLLVLGDAALYVCNFDGAIRRCSMYQHLKELVVKDDDATIGFKHESEQDVDLLLRFPTEQQQHREVISIIRKIYWTHVGKDIPIVKLAGAEKITGHVRLSKPAGWVLRIEPLRKAAAIQKMVGDQRMAEQKAEERLHEEFVRLKQDLLGQMELARNAQYDRMVKQSVDYVAKYQELLEQNAALKHQLDRLEPYAGGDDASPRSPPRAQRVVSPTQPATSKCARCVELEHLLEQHPNADKRRAKAAEEAVETLEKQMHALEKSIEPDRKELQQLRKLVASLEGVLRDQAVAPAERVKAAIRLTGATVYSGAVGGPPPKEYKALEHEVATLRGLIRDANTYHMVELQELRTAVAEYDREMVKAVRAALEALPFSSGEPLASQSQRIVDEAKSGLRNSQQQQRVGTSSPPPQSSGIRRTDSPRHVRVMSSGSDGSQRSSPSRVRKQRSREFRSPGPIPGFQDPYMERISSSYVPVSRGTPPPAPTNATSRDIQRQTSFASQDTVSSSAFGRKTSSGLGRQPSQQYSSPVASPPPMYRTEIPAGSPSGLRDAHFIDSPPVQWSGY